MKLIFTFCLGILCPLVSAAQHPISQNHPDFLPVVYLKKSFNVHFISPEMISYADISSPFYKGDIPIKNVFRIKLSDSVTSRAPASILTIAGETVLYQFRLIQNESVPDSLLKSHIEISSGLGKSISPPVRLMPASKLREISAQILESKVLRGIAFAKKSGLLSKVNKLYTLGDYIFLDLTVENLSNLLFDIGEISFSLEDIKINAATNAQSIDIRPVFTLLGQDSFTRTYRNVFVFRKFTYPENKVFQIHLSERQLSGRFINLKLKYGDLLRADTFINN